MKASALLAALTVSVVAGTAHAAPVRYDYSGTCLLNCSAIGVSNGASVTGFLIAGSGFASDGILWSSELVDFGFSFGSVSISDSTHFAGGFLNLNPDLSINYSVPLAGLTFQSLGTGASTGVIGGEAGWTARNGLRVAIGGGTYTPVPLPGSLALLGLGLAGLGLAALRRR